MQTTVQPSHTGLPAIPLPPHLSNLVRDDPAVLTFGQVVEVFVFWNFGGEKYARDLRDCGELVSVNGFPHGQRARYATRAVLKIYTDAMAGSAANWLQPAPTGSNCGG